MRRVTIFAPPVVTQFMLLDELRAWGFKTEIVDDIQAVKTQVEAEGVDVLIIDPLRANEDDRVIIEKLTRCDTRMPF
jgi:hypothetical protein